MIYRSLSDERLKPYLYPVNIADSVESLVSGSEGECFVTRKEHAFFVLGANVTTPTSLKDLKVQDIALCVSDGNALR